MISEIKAAWMSLKVSAIWCALEMLCEIKPSCEASSIFLETTLYPNSLIVIFDEITRVCCKLGVSIGYRLIWSWNYKTVKKLFLI